MEKIGIIISSVLMFMTLVSMGAAYVLAHLSLSESRENKLGGRL